MSPDNIDPARALSGQTFCEGLTVHCKGWMGLPKIAQAESIRWANFNAIPLSEEAPFGPELAKPTGERRIIDRLQPL